MKEYNDIYFSGYAEQGDPDYKAFYDRVKNDPNDTVYKSTKAALERMRAEQVVIHTTDRILSAHFRLHRQQQSIVVFARGYTQFRGSVVGKNSPLKPILSSAFRKLYEQGAIDRILHANEGPAIKQQDVPDVLILSAGHVALILIITSAFLATAMALFVAEVCHKKWLNSSDASLYPQLSCTVD